jgi:hypothetical protein
LGSQKKFFCRFSKSPTKKCLIQIHVSLCLVTLPQGPKKDTIGVTGRTSAKLPHCIGPALAYLMENEMPFVHHAIEWWGCSYVIEDNRNINERT